MLGLIPAGPCGGGLMLGLANPRVGFESGVLWVAVHDPVVGMLLTAFLAAAMAVKWCFPRGCGSALVCSRAGMFPARPNVEKQRETDPRGKTPALENARAGKTHTQENTHAKTAPAQENTSAKTAPAQENTSAGQHPRKKHNFTATKVAGAVGC